MPEEAPVASAVFPEYVLISYSGNVRATLFSVNWIRIILSHYEHNAIAKRNRRHALRKGPKGHVTRPDHGGRRRTISLRRHSRVRTGRHHGRGRITNGAFYPHFRSKAELVRESVGAALEHQSAQMRQALASGGPEMAIEAYLSAAHRDNPGKGCASAALLPELARQPPETREVYTERLLTLVRQLSAALPRRPRIRKALPWASLRPSSARCNWPAPSKGRNCRIASSRRGKLPRGR